MTSDETQTKQDETNEELNLDDLEADLEDLDDVEQATNKPDEKWNLDGEPAPPSAPRETNVQQVRNYSQSSIELRIGGTGNQLKLYFYEPEELVEQADKIANSDDLWEYVDKMKDRVNKE